ncbi:hypothetical protein [Mucilaginibacter phyllosphaerae]|uniref:O-antigen ligase domain-containing protein n=1 Tax=Mucilaginibacter phyllosphaerae TaxID=1812349 RepID=A0A4Y8A9G3_9SPHI|nr:hypothetical protein [Mucilaginibacter phyllosphaerae]MBB3969690.1 hypothetical protein [Mucilaginibacter phyllosphaerae]TEW65074.1 hypothetical protein E2R65_14250 [Mucilaginibacter phyllosphaerae]
MLNTYPNYPFEHTGPFIKKYVNVLMLFFPVTAFLLIPAIPSTTITTVFAGLMLLLIPLSSFKEEKTWFAIELLYFFSVLFVLSFCSQFINLVSHLKLTNNLILINRNDFTKTFYRTSHLTQTLSLVVGFIIYTYVKYFSKETIINYIYWGLRLLCIYGLYEFCFYILTGQSGDFVVNRTFGDGEKSGSLFQTVSLGGLSLMRFKGYTGEPSMFVFTVFPFWVLSFGLKRTFDQYFLLGCLILSFSTTAYLSIMMFLTFWLIYKRQFQIFYYLSIFIVIVCFILQLDRFQHLLDSIYNFVFAGKIQGHAASSRDRSNAFNNHISFWASLNGFNQAFGIGFGYVRSTDFFSTIIVNNGLIGFLVFTWFVLKNIWLKIPNRLLSICYKIGLFMVYLIMMATVPEFAYPSLWIYIGLGFVLQQMH